MCAVRDDDDDQQLVDAVVVVAVVEDLSIWVVACAASEISSYGGVSRTAKRNLRRGMPYQGTCFFLSPLFVW